MNTNFEQTFMERSPQVAFLIDRFRKAIGKDHVSYDDVNTSNLRRFKNYMEEKVSANSLRTYFATFSAYIRECHSDGYIDNDKCLDVLKVKKTPQQNVALTEEELAKIQEYYDDLFTKPKHKSEKDVLTLFLIECYSGARGCDVEAFTPENIQNGMLSYVSQKTKTFSTMPAHKYLPTLISRISKKKYTRASKNRILKKVCKKVGITDMISLYYHGKQTFEPKYKYIAFHSGRRSYVTNLLNRGASILSVSRMCGHSDIKMAQKYYCDNSLHLDENAMSFFM